MNTQPFTLLPHEEQAAGMLFDLAVPVYRRGYACLHIGIPRFALDKGQSLSKELYPYIAAQLGYPSWQAVESAIRDVIADAWESRDPEVWKEYFPNQRKPPSNKQFIATLAERLR